MFETGTKVVCINGKFPQMHTHMTYTDLPIEGEIYTVRDAVAGWTYRQGRTVALYLQELINPCNDAGIEFGFDPTRFRELDETENINKKKESEPKKAKV